MQDQDLHVVTDNPQTHRFKTKLKTYLDNRTSPKAKKLGLFIHDKCTYVDTNYDARYVRIDGSTYCCGVKGGDNNGLDLACSGKTMRGFKEPYDETKPYKEYRGCGWGRPDKTCTEGYCPGAPERSVDGMQKKNRCYSATGTEGVNKGVAYCLDWPSAISAYREFRDDDVPRWGEACGKMSSNGSWNGLR